MRATLLLLGLCSMGLTSCKNKKNIAEGNTEVSSKEISLEKTADSPMAPFGKQLGGQLIGKYWKAIEIMGKPVTMPEGMSQEPFLRFKQDGSIAANGGCNAIFGNYELGVKNFVEIYGFSQTERACGFEGYEEQLTEALTFGKQYIFPSEDVMHLIIGKRAPLAKFEAVYMK